MMRSKTVTRDDSGGFNLAPYYNNVKKVSEQLLPMIIEAYQKDWQHEVPSSWSKLPAIEYLNSLKDKNNEKI
jgi:hypothetical protein